MMSVFDQIQVEADNFLAKLMEQYDVQSVVLLISVPTGENDDGGTFWRGNAFAAYGQAKKFVIDTETLWKEGIKQEE